ncbi:FIVAR domain-containing protein, partial [Pseudoflavonifractor capillosus]|uniref:LPXTG cell wall anchor domain-containing protein n=1 Tax=Pseudoflavonifractor capillosus TaxID=106588 RepID=UPI00195CA662
DLLNKAENLNLEGYTADSVAVFRSALAEAQALMADETLTEDDQKTVDAAVATLSAAMDGLTAGGAPEATDQPQASQKPEATDKPENVPQTGDTASLLPWAAALALSGAAALWVVRRKERN